MKLIVAGSRWLKNVDQVFRYLDYIHSKIPIEEIVCGEARGPDRFGSQWAFQNNIKVVSFIPKWDELGKKAGILRNMEMGDYAAAGLVFWMDSRRGARHMIDYLTTLGKPVLWRKV